MKTIALILFLLMPLVWANAQNTIGLPEIVNYNKNDYHGATQTWDMAQDKMGRIYFANNDGLLTFDGTFWKQYIQPNRSILRSIAISGNRIYAGGQDEVGYFAPDTKGSLSYTSLKNLIPATSKRFTDVWDTEIHDGAVYFLTWEFILEYKNETVQAYPAPTGWLILRKIGNSLYAQDKTKGLFRFVNGQWEAIQTNNPAPSMEITGIGLLKDKSLLIGTLQHGLFTFTNGVLSPKKTSIDQRLITNHIYRFVQLNDSEFVAGTTSEGFFVLNADGEMIQQIARPEGLQNNNVLSLFLDKDKNIWAGLNNGISFVAYNSALKYIQPNKNNEVSGYAARIFNNKLYIGTSDGAYVTPLPPAEKDYSFLKGSFRFLPGSSGQVWRFDEINHKLLMGHHNGCFVISDEQLQQLTNDRGIWNFFPLSPIIPSAQVIAGSYSGMNMLLFDGNRFTNGGKLQGINESLRFIAIDNNNTLWAAHPYRGVYKIELSSDKKSYSAQLLTKENGLPSTFRNFVFKIKNRVIFATEKGLYEFDNNQMKFVQSPLLYDVFGPINIQYLNEDNDGNIWFCSGKQIGVATFSKNATSKPQVIYFPEMNGKVLSIFESIYPFNRQNIFVASDKGMIHLNLDKYTKNHPVPQVLLTQIRVFGTDNNQVYDGYPMSNNQTEFVLQQNSVPDFSINNNSFHFEFSSPVFSQQKNIEYATQLVGYESSWSAWSPKTEKDYTKLPHGTYVFKVKAHDNLGNESAVINYKFVVNPAWYQTKLAYGFFILLIIAGLYYLNKWQEKKFVTQRIKFQEEQEKLKYIHQLELEKNEKEIIQLQNEKLASEVIFKNKELADVSMRLVERSDALNKVKDELQKLYKKTGENHDIKRTIHLLNTVEQNNSSWEQFAAHFDEINNDFLKKMKSKFPTLTNTDLKVCAYLQLNLSSKEIAQLMNISVRGVEISRYRLRKKLNLKTEQTLTDFLNELNRER